MTCRTLFALFSAAVGWYSPLSGNIILAQAKQDASAQTPDAATNAKEEANADASVLQMQAKKNPPKPKAKAKKAKTPTKPAKSKAAHKSVPKPAPKPAPKAVPKPIPKPAPKPVPKPVSKPAPYFQPSEPIPLPPTDNSHFQVPLPEEKGDLNIWGDDATNTGLGLPSVPGSNQIGMIGLVNYLGAGAGIDYWRRSFSWMDWGLHIAVTNARLKESKNPEIDELMESSMVTAGVSARFFNNRWLYLSSGLSFNSLKGSYGWKGDGVADNKIAVDFDAQMILLNLAIGSQWDFGRFYIGADWLGLGLPIGGSISYDENPDVDDITRVLTGSSTDERISKELSVQFRPYYGLIRFGYLF